MAQWPLGVVTPCPKRFRAPASMRIAKSGPRRTGAPRCKTYIADRAQGRLMRSERPRARGCAARA
eukprot:3892082-Lingulodinium_polyedra.AAC.1